MFSIFFFNRGLVLDVKGQNPKAQPFTLKIVALRNFWKIFNFGKNPKKIKNCYLEIRLYIQKRLVKIKPKAAQPSWKTCCLTTLIIAKLIFNLKSNFKLEDEIALLPSSASTSPPTLAEVSIILEFIFPPTHQISSGTSQISSGTSNQISSGSLPDKHRRPTNPPP